MTDNRCTASKTIKIEIRMRKIPFEKPDSVSIRLYLQDREPNYKSKRAKDLPVSKFFIRRPMSHN